MDTSQILVRNIYSGDRFIRFQLAHPETPGPPSGVSCAATFSASGPLGVPVAGPSGCVQGERTATLLQR
eukprot:scaffold1305_cov248-Pinguiococcus_pyrenoidosus.AAC.9